MGFEFFRHFKDEPKATPKLAEQEISLFALGTFGQVTGKIMRDKELPPHRWGDSIWENKRAICVVDASAPRDGLLHLGEASIASDLERELKIILSGDTFNPDELLEAINGVLTLGNRNMWRGNAEFGLSVGGVYCGDDGLITAFNIGTGAVYINDKLKIQPNKMFHNPQPPPESDVTGNLPVSVLKLPVSETQSIIICTDGVDVGRFSPNPTSWSISDSLAKGTNEATILRLGI